MSWWTQKSNLIQWADESKIKKKNFLNKNIPVTGSPDLEINTSDSRLQTGGKTQTKSALEKPYLRSANT